MKDNFFKNQSGFSLIMVMVATVLVSMIAMFLTGIIGNAQKGQKSVQNAVDFDILKTSINMVLNTKACDGAFKDSLGNNVQINFGTTPLTLNPPLNIIANGESVSISQIKLGNSIVAETGGNLGGGLIISKIEFINAIYDGDHLLGSPQVTYKAFVATLNIEAQTSKNIYGNQNPKQSFTTRILLRPNADNSAGIVEKCSAARSSNGFSKIVTFDASSTFTVPDGVSRLKVELWGAGGGGGGATDSPVGSPAGIASGGGGGGGGEYSSAYLTVVPGEVFQVTVGAGGAGGAICVNCAAGPGRPGGFSSFGTQLVALGGMNGTGATPSAVGIFGAGGSSAAVAGTLRHAGAAGGYGGYNYEARSFVSGGAGGSAGGGGGAGGVNVGQAGAIPGGGGSGGHRYSDLNKLRPGAPGARGRVVVHY